MQVFNAPDKIVHTSLLVFEVTKTGKLKLVKLPENDSEEKFTDDEFMRELMEHRFVDDWIAFHSDKNKKYIIQKCIQLYEE